MITFTRTAINKNSGLLHKSILFVGFFCDPLIRGPSREITRCNTSRPGPCKIKKIPKGHGLNFVGLFFIFQGPGREILDRVKGLLRTELFIRF